MNLASLAVLVGLLAPGQQGVDMKGLIERLGASRYSEREDATKALEAAGRVALPALRESRKSADPEVRERVSLLIDKIEADWLVHPTMIRLDYRDRPLSEVVASLSDQTGISLQLVPENPALWESRKVTLESPIPLPFWVALDRLCQAAQIRHGLEAGGPIDLRTSSLQLYAGDPTTDAPLSDSGPFRSIVTRIHHETSRLFGQAGRRGMLGGGAVIIGQRGQEIEAATGNGPGQRSEQFYVQIQVMSEPRMAISQGGVVKLEECIDDKGQSLVPPQASPSTTRSSGYYGMNAMTSLQTQVALVYPDQPGRTIKRLRGSMPVILAARKDEPLVIMLDQAKGKTFQSDEVAITIHDVGEGPNNQPGISIDLTLRPLVADAAGPAGMAIGQVSVLQAQQAPQRQMDILDAQGRPYRQWYPSSSRVSQEEARMTLTLMPTENLGPPAQILFYSMTRATAEVNFDFRDVVMP